MKRRGRHRLLLVWSSPAEASLSKSRSTERPVTSASFLRLVADGSASPCSHSHTVGCRTPTKAASADCDLPLSLIQRRSASMLLNIGESYAESIGPSYSDLKHDSAMAKTAKQIAPTETSLDRIVRAASIRFGRVVNQTEIAKAAGVKQPTVNEWKERPEGGPRISTAISLSAWCGVSIDYIYRGTEPMFSGPSQDKRLAALLDVWPLLDDFDKGVILGQAMAAANKKRPR